MNVKASGGNRAAYPFSPVKLYRIQIRIPVAAVSRYAPNEVVIYRRLGQHHVRIGRIDVLPKADYSVVVPHKTDATVLRGDEDCCLGRD